MTNNSEFINSMNTSSMTSVDWLELRDPNDENQTWRLHVPFLLSNWECLFGRGCPGTTETTPQGGAVSAGTDVGCCNHGAFLEDKEDTERLAKHVAMLTEDDLHKKALDYVKREGYLVTFNEEEDEYNVKTKVRNGACVFANRYQDVREGDDPNRIGCAFIHLAARLNNMSTTKSVDHTSTMPKVCWQLPFKTDHEYPDFTDEVITTIYPWDAAQWNEEGNADYFEWWCVNSADAYSHKEPLFVSAKAELTALMGKEAYELAAVELTKRRKANYVEPMPAVGPNGRKMLPLSVEPQG